MSGRIPAVFVAVSLLLVVFIGSATGQDDEETRLLPPPDKHLPGKVIHGSGAILTRNRDLRVPHPSVNVHHLRQYSSLFKTPDGENEGANGYRWMVTPNSATLVKKGDKNLALHSGPASKVMFYHRGDNEYESSSWFPGKLRFAGQGSDRVRIVDQPHTNDLYIFHAENDQVPAKQRTRLKEHTTPELQEKGQPGARYHYEMIYSEARGKDRSRMDYIETAHPDRRFIDYHYYREGIESSRLKKIEVHRAGRESRVVKKARYTYFGNVENPPGDLGTPGDLVQVVMASRQDGGRWYRRTVQYRYNDRHQLTMIIEHEQLQRMIDYAPGDDIETATDLLNRDSNHRLGEQVRLKYFAARRFKYYESDVSTRDVDTVFRENENLNERYGGKELSETSHKADRMARQMIDPKFATGVREEARRKTMTFYYLHNDTPGHGSNVVDLIFIMDVVGGRTDKPHRRLHGLNVKNQELRKLIYYPTTGELIGAKSQRFDGKEWQHRPPSAYEGKIKNREDIVWFLDPSVG